MDEIEPAEFEALVTDAVEALPGEFRERISNVAFSLATKDERRSSFSLDVLADRPFVLATIASVVLIVLMTSLDLLNRFLGTTSLNFDQWVVCILVGLAIIPIAEVRKRIWNVEEEAAPAQPAQISAATA